MKFSLDFINSLYIGKESLNSEPLLRDIFKIWDNVQSTEAFKSYMDGLNKEYFNKYNDNIEILYFNIISAIDIIDAIITKEVSENERGIIQIKDINNIFMNLLYNKEVEVFPMTHAMYKTFRNIRYGNNNANPEELFKQLKVESTGSNKGFIKKYIEYLPCELLDKLHEQYTGPTIKTVLTIKNEAGEVLFEGPNELHINKDGGELFTTTINITGEDCRKYFKNKIKLKPSHINEFMSDVRDSLALSNHSKPDLSGCVIPILGPIFGASLFSVDAEVSEQRKELFDARVSQIKKEQEIMGSDFKPEVKLGSNESDKTQESLKFLSPHAKYKYVYDSLKNKTKTKAELAREFFVTVTRITEMRDNYERSVRFRTSNKDLCDLLGNEERVIKLLARAGISARELKDMYMKDSSLKNLKEIKGIGDGVIGKILKYMK